jgi:hypothetical protein
MINFGNSEEQRQQVCEAWVITAEQLAPYMVIYHNYWYIDHEGNGVFVGKEIATGKLVMCVGGHCSCHGLEDQFEPMPVSAEFLVSEHNPEWNAEEKEFFRSTEMQASK